MRPQHQYAPAFGAFPSLHAASATMEALFISHFFPHTTKWVFGYAAVLYWATMYLTHHYLIDVVCGACLATGCFYFFMPEELKGTASVAGPGPAGSVLGGASGSGSGVAKPRRTVEDKKRATRRIGKMQKYVSFAPASLRVYSLRMALLQEARRVG